MPSVHLFSVQFVFVTQMFSYSFGVNVKSAQVVNSSLKNLTNNKILGSLLKGDKILDIRQLQKTIDVHKVFLLSA